MSNNAPYVNLMTNLQWVDQYMAESAKLAAYEALTCFYENEEGTLKIVYRDMPEWLKELVHIYDESYAVRDIYSMLLKAGLHYASLQYSVEEEEKA